MRKECKLCHNTFEAKETNYTGRVEDDCCGRCIDKILDGACLF